MTSRRMRSMGRFLQSYPVILDVSKRYWLSLTTLSIVVVGLGVIAKGAEVSSSIVAEAVHTNRGDDGRSAYQMDTALRRSMCNATSPSISGVINRLIMERSGMRIG